LIEDLCEYFTEEQKIAHAKDSIFIPVIFQFRHTEILQRSPHSTCVLSNRQMAPPNSPSAAEAAPAWPFRVLYGGKNAELLVSPYRAEKRGDAIINSIPLAEYISNCTSQKTERRPPALTP